MSDTSVAGSGDAAGMSAASRAERDVDLRTGHEAVAIDPETEIGTVEHDGETLAQPDDHRLVATAEDVTADRVFRRSATGGGDAKKLRRGGIPTVEFALGTDTVHAPDEYVRVDVLVDNAVVYAQLPARWQSQITR